MQKPLFTVLNPTYRKEKYKDCDILSFCKKFQMPMLNKITFLILFMMNFSIASKPMLKSNHTFQQNSGISLDFLVYKPKELNENIPLVLFLHGAGERGNDLDLVEIHGYPKMVKEGSEFSFILVAPQCPEERWWDEPELVTSLLEITKYCVNTLPVDPQRIYATGLSMGGYGTFSLAIQRPDLFAAIIPVCGVADLKKVNKLKDMPIWIFHGDADNLVPVENSINVFKILEPINPKVKMTIYEGVGHDSWTETYENPDVMDWLLSQRKSN